MRNPQNSDQTSAIYLGPNNMDTLFANDFNDVFTIKEVQILSRYLSGLRDQWVENFYIARRDWMQLDTMLEVCLQSRHPFVAGNEDLFKFIAACSSKSAAVDRRIPESGCTHPLRLQIAKHKLIVAKNSRGYPTVTSYTSSPILNFQQFGAGKLLPRPAGFMVYAAIQPRDKIAELIDRLHGYPSSRSSGYLDTEELIVHEMRRMRAKYLFWHARRMLDRMIGEPHLVNKILGIAHIGLSDLGETEFDAPPFIPLTMRERALEALCDSPVLRTFVRNCRAACTTHPLRALQLEGITHTLPGEIDEVIARIASLRGLHRFGMELHQVFQEAEDDDGMNVEIDDLCYYLVHINHHKTSVRGSHFTVLDHNKGYVFGRPHYHLNTHIAPVKLDMLTVFAIDVPNKKIHFTIIAPPVINNAYGPARRYGGFTPMHGRIAANLLIEKTQAVRSTGCQIRAYFDEMHMGEDEVIMWCRECDLVSA